MYVCMYMYIYICTSFPDFKTYIYMNDVVHITLTHTQMAAAVAEEEAREKEEGDFNISFDTALASCKGGVNVFE